MSKKRVTCHDSSAFRPHAAAGRAPRPLPDARLWLDVLRPLLHLDQQSSGLCTGNSRRSLGRPALDVLTKPQKWPLGSEVDHGSWHIGVSPLVQAHAVGVCQSQDLGDSACIDEILGIDKGTHGRRSTPIDKPSQALDSIQKGLNDSARAQLYQSGDLDTLVPDPDREDRLLRLLSGAQIEQTGFRADRTDTFCHSPVGDKIMVPGLDKDGNSSDDVLPRKALSLFNEILSRARRVRGVQSDVKKGLSNPLSILWQMIERLAAKLSDF